MTGSKEGHCLGASGWQEQLLKKTARGKQNINTEKERKLEMVFLKKEKRVEFSELSTFFLFSLVVCLGFFSPKICFYFQLDG